MDASDTMERAEQAAGSETARLLVLAGWGAKAVVYLAVAWLVLQVARGGASEEASATGALRLIQDSTGGTLVLVLVGVGLLLYAGGRVLEITALATAEVEAKDKVEAGVMTVIYVALAVTAFVVAGSGGEGGPAGGEQEQRGTALLLDLPLGRVVVGLLGLAVIGVGAYAAWKGVRRDFLPTLRREEMSPSLRTWTERIGVVAYVTKGAVFALVGWFLLQAALTYDAAEAVGLDGALQRVAAASWGRSVLLATSLGLLAYAAFCALEARYRKVGVSAGGTV